MKGKIKILDTEIGKRIRLARREISMTQEVLADRLEISFQQVQKYENAKNRCSSSTLYLIAEIVGKPITFFYNNEEILPSYDNDDLRFLKYFRKIKKHRIAVLKLIQYFIHFEQNKE